MNVYEGKKVLFLTHYPYGLLENVEVLGFHKDNLNKIYITRAKGGTDTTVKEFLFDYPRDYES